jgi:hypothetical protein
MRLRGRLGRGEVVEQFLRILQRVTPKALDRNGGSITKSAVFERDGFPEPRKPSFRFPRSPRQPKNRAPLLPPALAAL